MSADDALDPVDITLLDDLAALHDQVDPPPEGLADRIKFSLTVAALEAELAEITEERLVPVRAEEPSLTDTVTFSSSRQSIMLSVSERGDDRLTIDGWLTTGGALVELHHGTKVMSVTADQNGRFVFADAPRGRVWFVVFPEGADRAQTAGGRPVVTPQIVF